MTEPDEHGTIETSDGMSVEHLEAFEQGWGAMVMPVQDGWKVQYFSIPTFDDEVGTVFPSLDEALGAVQDMLPRANAVEERVRAQIERAWLRSNDAPHL